jgi:hypothetical protein
VVTRGVHDMQALGYNLTIISVRRALPNIGRSYALYHLREPVVLVLEHSN